MAVPKGKISKARKHSRRANWKISAPGIAACPRCQHMNCGYYGNEQVLKTEEAAPAKA